MYLHDCPQTKAAWYFRLKPRRFHFPPRPTVTASAAGFTEKNFPIFDRWPDCFRLRGKKDRSPVLQLQLRLFQYPHGRKKSFHFEPVPLPPIIPGEKLLRVPRWNPDCSGMRGRAASGLKRAANKCAKR